ncbi:MAG: protein-L-isoaspartate O-methyltransferase [Patescibacteria group bacterium]
MKHLVTALIHKGVLKTPALIEAFEDIDRKNFVPVAYADEAYEDSALPIGHGQTISQPYTVAFMLELLQPKRGDKVLDVGSGSGWQTALLAHIVGTEGTVIGIERIPELKEMGEKNISRYDFIQKGIVTVLSINAEDGLPKEAPFDCIISGASAQEVPAAWKEQLSIGGRIVMPVHDSIFLIIKQGENEFREEEYPGFSFVPFIHKK